LAFTLPQGALCLTRHPSDDFRHDIDRLEMLSSNLATAVGHWSLSRPALKGFWSAVYEEEGGIWTMRTHTYDVTPPPAAAQVSSPPSR
jgi:hypothetical protein